MFGKKRLFVALILLLLMPIVYASFVTDFIGSFLTPFEIVELNKDYLFNGDNLVITIKPTGSGVSNEVLIYKNLNEIVIIRLDCVSICYNQKTINYKIPDDFSGVYTVYVFDYSKNDFIGKDFFVESGFTTQTASDVVLNISLQYPNQNKIVIEQYNSTWFNATVNCTLGGVDCGEVWGTLRFNLSGNNPDTAVPISYSGMFDIVKVLGADPISKWNKTYNFGADLALDVATNSKNDAYVIGFDAIGGLFGNWIAMKFNENGTNEWIKIYDLSGVGGNDIPSGIAVDSIDKIYIVGLENNLDWGVVKINSTGHSLWNKTYNIGSTDEAKDVAIDSNDDLYVVGYNGSNDWYVMKINNNGVSQWNRSYDVGGIDRAEAVAIDSNDDLYVVGQENNVDWRVMKIDSDGVSLLNKTYNLGTSDIAYGVSIDNKDNIYIVGQEINANQDFGIMKLQVLNNPAYCGTLQENQNCRLRFKVNATIVDTRSIDVLFNSINILINDNDTRDVIGIVTMKGDLDNDKIIEVDDNCLNEPNPSQLDADLDGYGNACDCDFDNTGICGTTDQNIFLDCFNKAVPTDDGPPEDLTCLESDMDGDNFVGFADNTLFMKLFGSSPGPSCIDSFGCSITPNITTNYYNGSTTDFSDPGFNPAGASNVVLEKVGYGIIRFNDSINFTQDRNIDSYSMISFNNASINTDVIYEFNVSANITFYNLNLTNPRILREGIECSSNICAILENNINLTFSVTHFTEYSAEEVATTTTTAEEDGSSSDTGGTSDTTSSGSTSQDNTTTIDNATTTAETTVSTAETTVSTTTKTATTIVVQKPESKTPLIIAGIVIAVAIIAASGAYLYYTKGFKFLRKKTIIGTNNIIKKVGLKKPVKGKQKADREFLRLRNAIRKSIKAGHSKEAIRKKAIKERWPKGLVERALK